MSKVINSRVLSETLTLTQYTDGFWLYDRMRGCNLSMRAESEEDALLKALWYYQNRFSDLESEYKSLKSKVDNFIGSVVDSNDCNDYYCNRCGSSSEIEYVGE